MSLKAYKEYETWYTGEINHKTPENARKLHALKDELDHKLRDMEALIIPAGQDLETGNVEIRFIKSMNEEFLTVSELNHFIRDVLNSGFPKASGFAEKSRAMTAAKIKSMFFLNCVKKMQ